MIPPSILLGMLALLIVIVGTIEAVNRRRLRRQYARLAREFHVHFSPRDRLRLTDRVAADFPVPGAAQVVVRDLLYSSDGKSHRYVFTVEYTRGTLRSRKRFCQAAAYSEPRDRSSPLRSEVKLGDDELPLLQQVKMLLGTLSHDTN